MMLSEFFGNLCGYAARTASIFALIGFFGVVLNTLFSYLHLRHIPGPQFAALTNLVRWQWVITGNAHAIHTSLHRQYGTVVRSGPNAVIVSQPKAIDQIYGFKQRFEKSEFYDAIMPRIKGGKLPDVFATRDEGIHRQMRRPVAGLFSVTNLLTMEPLMTSTLHYFFARLDEQFADLDIELDLFKWIQFFMFDVLGEVTFSQKLGFLEHGKDVEGIIQSIWLYFKAIAPTTQMPWLDYLWRDNPLVPASSHRNSLAEVSIARITERLSLDKDEKQKISQKDFLSCFIREKAKDPSLPALFVPTWVNSNIVAGADTTSILASATMYHLLKNPSTLSKLRQEIDDATAEGRLSKYVTWAESQTLPYLEACVNEATRMHPPFALPFERVVPASGLEIDGYFIPPGTRIGINPWSVHRETSLYGKDPEAWRPERWLCDKEKRKAMNDALLTFGAGHRACAGKNLAYFEIYKLIPSLLQRYNIELMNPAQEWTIENKWLTKPSGFHVKLSKRHEDGH